MFGIAAHRDPAKRKAPKTSPPEGSPPKSSPPKSSQPSALAHTGAGAGLTGLKERAALAGGTLEAGPADGIWRIGLTIPA